MSIKNTLQNTNRFQRIWLVTAGMWILIANILYFANLGTCAKIDFSLNTIINPILVTIWQKLTFNIDALQLYVYEGGGTTGCGSDMRLYYNIGGHLYFVFVPFLFIGLAYMANDWIQNGSRSLVK